MGGPDAVKEVMEMTGGGVQHSFEAIGLSVTAEQSFNMLRRGGTANIIGMIPVGQMISLMGAAFLGEKRIQGSLMGSNRFPVDMPRLVDAYMTGKLHLDDMISRRIRLDQVATVSDTVAEPRSAALMNGQPVVGFEVSRSRGESEVVVGAAVLKALDEFKAQHPDLVLTEAFNFVQPVQEEYDGSLKLLYEGAILAVVV
eukprot:gene36332-59417_t